MSTFLQRNLTLRQLRLLSMLGKTLSLSRSAEGLSTTQPAVSRALLQLEDLLQVRLFERTTKRVVPTPAGLSMIRHAERVLAEIEQAEHSLRDLRGGIRGELRIGTLPTFSVQRVSAATLRTTEMLPDVHVDISTGEVAELRAALYDGRIDLMLAHAEWTVDLNDIEVTAIYEEHSSVVAARDHPLAQRPRVEWGEVAQERWILPPHNTPLRPKLDRMLSLHRGIDRDCPADVQVESSLQALMLVRGAPLLWATADHYASDYEANGLVRRLSLPAPLLQGPMCAFRLRKDKIRPFVRVFLDDLLAVA